ncbi:MAG: hypothetical protein ABUT20_52015 [Bacteroidota bacterium]
MLSKSQLKYIQSLGHKKFRDEEGLFIAEGPKIVKELINEIPGQVKSVFALKEWLADNKDSLANIEVNEITDIELERISQLSAPNKVVAVVKKLNNEHFSAKNKITLALDTIQDP